MRDPNDKMTAAQHRRFFCVDDFPHWPMHLLESPPPVNEAPDC
jgi:hypothetical protein